MHRNRLAAGWSVFAGCVFLALLLPQTGSGVTRYVAPGGAGIAPYTNWAMAAQNIATAVGASSAGDEVVVSNGTYAVASNIILMDDIRVRSLNGAAVTTVNGTAAGSRCFYIGHTNAVLEGFTLTSRISGGGAGVLFEAAGGTMRDCVVRDCSSVLGGGVLAQANARIENCEFVNNVSSNGGGGAYLTISSTISNCTFRGNTAISGGAVYFERAGRALSCLVVSNSASWYGGGIYCSSTGTLVDACTITDNTVTNYDGGGVFFNGRNTIRNSLVARNRAGQSAGGIYGSHSVVESSTFVSNYAVGNAGGVYLQTTSTVWNSIVLYNNTAGGGASNFGYDVTAVYTGCCIAPMPPTGGGNFTADPMFVNAGAGNYRLMSNSPCIDRNVAIGPATRDLDGVLRPQDGNGDGIALYDVGAYERERPRSGAANDYSGNGVSDLPVFNPPDGAWYIRRVTGSVVTWANQWGWSTAMPVVGDYNGDGKWDLAVFDTVGGYWYIKNISGTVIAWANQWGWSTAKPVPGDYNGDGKWDQAVFDTVGGFWYIKKVTGGVISWANQWGWSTAKPVPGDYDGDGKWDMAVFDTEGGRWYIQRVTGTPILWANQWGWSTAKPVPGDYDGDGKWDQAVFDTVGGFWYIKKVTGGVIAWANQWGWSTAKPVPGDYDGDGKYDLAVYDTATGLWYVKSLDGRVLAWASQWGWPGATTPALEAAQ